MKPETLLTKRILARLKKIPYSHWEKIQQQGKRGTADIIGTLLGKSYHIEVKYKYNPRREKRELLQLLKLGKNCQALGSSYILHSDNWQFHIERWERAAKIYKQKEELRNAEN